MAGLNDAYETFVKEFPHAACKLKAVAEYEVTSLPNNVFGYQHGIPYPERLEIVYDALAMNQYSSQSRDEYAAVFEKYAQKHGLPLDREQLEFWHYDHYKPEVETLGSLEPILDRVLENSGKSDKCFAAYM